MRYRLAIVAATLLAASQARSAQDLGPVVNLVNQAAGTVFSADQAQSVGSTHGGYHAVKCLVNIVSLTGTLTVTIYGKDGASGTYYTLLASTALAAPGQTVLSVGPALTASTNVTVNDYLPAVWRVGAVVATGPATATVGCSVVE